MNVKMTQEEKIAAIRGSLKGTYSSKQLLKLTRGKDFK